MHYKVLEGQNPMLTETFLVEFSSSLKFDEFVKSRHSGENRSPDGPQLLENTGFRLLPE
jgi:hypothetical protein